jgi:hypothetical protein
VGVLNKADKIGGPRGDPLARAAQVAERFSTALRSEVSGMIPVAGLLAESAATDLGNNDAHHLGVLAGLGEQPRRRMLTSVDRFEAFESEVPETQRARLLGMLDLFGLECSLGLVDSGVRGATALCDELLEISGIGALRDLIDDTFRRNAACLKAEVALAELERIAYSPFDEANGQALSWLRGRLDDTRLEPQMHELNEVWALQEASGGAVTLPTGLEADLRRLVTERSVEARLGLESGASRPEIQRAAAAGASRWGAFANDGRASLVESRIGRVAYRSYVMLHQQVDSRATAGAR